MLPYLHERCVDVLMPDCGHTGGISQMKKIGALAEAYHVPLAPHSILSVLGLSASLHAVAAIPNFLIHECYPDMLPPEVARRRWEVDKNGYASLPEGPGLGVDVDEAFIDSIKDDPKYKFSWPQPKLGDGSVTDY
jgi:galactonate dehydratase